MVPPEDSGALSVGVSALEPNWADHAEDEINLNRAQRLWVYQRMICPLEMTMSGTKQPNQDTGLENLSVNSSRRSSVQEDGTGNPAHQDGKHDINESARVPDQQIPVEQSPEIEDTEGHPT